MLFPGVTSRMKEFDHISRVRIDSGQVRTFVEVTLMTREGEVLGVVRSAVFPGHDVLDVKAKDRIILLVNPAVFTAISGELPDTFSKTFVHQSPVC